MKLVMLTLLLTSVWVTGGHTQEPTSQGPVWDLQFIRTKPNQRDAYLLSLKQNARPIWDEEKRQGLILDYKVFNNLTQHDPQEWDIEVAIQFKNFAALDGFEAKERLIASKMAGPTPAGTQQLGDKRLEMREILSTRLIQEILLQ
jgi:hypothetical protein